MDTPQPFATWAECKAAIEAFDEEWSANFIDIVPSCDWAHVVIGDYNLGSIDGCLESYFEMWATGCLENIKRLNKGDPYGLRGALIEFGEYLSAQYDLLERIKASDVEALESDDNYPD